MTRKVIDPECPWKIPTLAFEFPDYVYKLSRREWQTLLALAEQGEPEAELSVAERFLEGCKDRSGRILVKKSSRKAFVWLRRSAEHGNSYAQSNLGARLGNKGPQHDISAAILWLKRAFRQGDTASAAINLAITYRDIGDFRKAVFWFRKAALSGDDDALLQLGIHYYWGIGARRNHAAGVRCFRKATTGKYISEADRDTAFFYLGIAYLEGNGVRRSAVTARKLLERANKDGDHPPAARVLRELERNRKTRSSN